MTAATPAVSAIIATRGRDELRAAVDGVLAQQYAGDIDAIVVFDGVEPDSALERSAPARDDQGARSVRVTRNVRTPGLAGARNSGIALATGELVGFCDDDDVWTTDKLAIQVPALLADDSVLAVGGIRIHYGDVVHVRRPPGSRITPEDLARSRVTGSHPSTYLIRTDALRGGLGLVDEELPHGYGEDYDLLLRAARAGGVRVVEAIVADVLWHPGGSYFSHRWDAMADGLGYLLAKHPEIAADRKGFAWMQGQRAFALAAQGHRRAALATAWTAFRASPREPRVPLALLVATRVVSPVWVVRKLNARGRGI